MLKIMTFCIKDTDEDINTFTTDHPNGKFMSVFGQLKYIYDDSKLLNVIHPIVSYRGNANLTILRNLWRDCIVGETRSFSGSYDDDEKQKYQTTDMFSILSMDIFENFAILNGDYEGEVTSLFINKYDDIYTDFEQTRPLSHEDFSGDYNQPILIRDYVIKHNKYNDDKIENLPKELLRVIDMTESVIHTIENKAYYGTTCYGFGFNQLIILAKFLDMDEFVSNTVYSKETNELIKNYKDLN